MISPLFGENIIKFRHSAQFLFENIHPFVFNNFSDLTVGIFEIAEFPGAGRTDFRTVAAADAPVVINNHNAVFFLPGGLDRANFDAGWVFALLTLHRHVIIIFVSGLVLRIIVDGALQIDVLIDANLFSITGYRGNNLKTRKTHLRFAT